VPFSARHRLSPRATAADHNHSQHHKPSETRKRTDSVGQLLLADPPAEGDHDATQATDSKDGLKLA
jgi:hypothetical protein